MSAQDGSPCGVVNKIPDSSDPARSRARRSIYYQERETKEYDQDDGSPKESHSYRCKGEFAALHGEPYPRADSIVYRHRPISLLAYVATSPGAVTTKKNEPFTVGR